MSKLTAKKPAGKRASAAKQIIEGEAWRATDPDAPPTKEGTKYTNSFLLRLNDWEMGALMEAAKEEGRSAQQQARLILRQALKEMISK
ncbi:MAG: hypothetical protein N0E55_10135 [Candidatus Thiodiazotropha taylori]|nr:hypothetical protein [Candidatus Thiodiazotropha taylori]MCG8092914.1 hypothetical protein [Candidatus Thiodiazotropha endolucinida]MCG8124304.1 hypothetical protein [Candidatus Thiodiazotropha taylori]MCW4253046.1 hypothetical protein [Candidatus Thiodiazotropha taylori]MCW4308792.1 hypothetical protein [Candidatus Thiodiazotropha endolucinida]